MRSTILWLFLVLCLAACSTGYQPQGFTGGFTDLQIEPGVFRISFAGNGYTRPRHAEDLALLRACEITLTNGYTCFHVLDAQNEVYTSTLHEPSSATTTFYGNTAQTTIYPGETVHIHRPLSVMFIQVFDAPPTGVRTFDAQFLGQQLAAQYHVKLSTVRPAPPASHPSR